MMACVESNKNCASPDQIFSSFLTPDAKTAIQQYASQPGPTQFAARPPAPPMMPGMMPGMGMPGMGMPGMGGFPPMGGMMGMNPMMA